MEKKLKALFDYQRFDKNERLEKLIQETENRDAKELSDDDLSLVNAAGELTMNPITKGKNVVANDGGTYHYGSSDGLGGKSAEPIGSGGGGGGGGAGGGSGAAMSSEKEKPL